MMIESRFEKMYVRVYQIEGDDLDKSMRLEDGSWIKGKATAGQHGSGLLK